MRGDSNPGRFKRNASWLHQSASVIVDVMSARKLQQVRCSNHDSNNAFLAYRQVVKFRRSGRQSKQFLYY